MSSEASFELHASRQVLNRHSHRDRKQTGGAGAGGLPMGTGPPLGVMKGFGARQRWWLPTPVNVLGASELLTFKWLVLRYVDFTSIF